MRNKLKYIYIILACFTLASTTIGATYAYWTASTTSTSNAIQAESTIYSISMEIKPLYTGFSFIPMNDTDALKAIKNQCKDKYNRGACTAYTIRVFGYQEDLDYISGTMDIATENMKNLSYMTLEEKEEYQEENCVKIENKNYCIAKEATPMGEGSNLSIGESYNVYGLNEKNLLLVIWLTNLNENQNITDIGNFNATVTILAGNGGKIKGTIASAIKIDDEPETQTTPDNNQNP